MCSPAYTLPRKTNSGFDTGSHFTFYLGKMEKEKKYNVLLLPLKFQVDMHNTPTVPNTVGTAQLDIQGSHSSGYCNNDRHCSLLKLYNSHALLLFHNYSPNTFFLRTDAVPVTTREYDDRATRKQTSVVCNMAITLPSEIRINLTSTRANES